MKFLISTFALATVALSKPFKDDLCITFGSPDTSFVKRCFEKDAPHLRARLNAASRIIVDIHPAVATASGSVLPQCSYKIVPAAPSIAETVEIAAVRFEGSSLPVDIGSAFTGSEVTAVMMNGTRMPLLQGDYIYRNIFIRKDDQTFASCFAKVDKASGDNIFYTGLYETEKHGSGWGCKFFGSMMSKYTKVPYVHILPRQLEAPLNIESVAIDAVGCNFGITEIRTDVDERREVMADADLRDALNTLEIPLDSKIVPYLTTDMILKALDDKNNSVQREVNKDDVNSVVPGCAQCEDYLGQLGIPSGSHIIPHLSTDVVASALNDVVDKSEQADQIAEEVPDLPDMPVMNERQEYLPEMDVGREVDALPQLIDVDATPQLSELEVDATPQLSQLEVDALPQLSEQSPRALQFLLNAAQPVTRFVAVLLHRPV